MADLKHLMEEGRQAHVPDPGAFDRLVRRRQRKQLRRRLVAGALAIVISAAGLSVAYRITGSRPGPSASRSPSASRGPTASASVTAPGTKPSETTGLFELNPRTGRLTHTQLPNPPPGNLVGSLGFPVLAAEGGVWIGEGGGPATVLRADPRTGRVEEVVISHTKVEASLLAAADNSVWALPLGSAGLGPAVPSGGGALARIDPASNRVVSHVPVPTGGAGLAVSGNRLWVARTDGVVERVNTDSDRLEHSIAAGPNASGLAAGAGYLWVADDVAGAVYRVDPVTGQVRAIALHGNADRIAADSSGAWVLDRQHGSVTQINPDGSVGDTVGLGPAPNSITAGEGAIWVADPGDGNVWRIDEATRQTTPYPLPQSPGTSEIAVGDGVVWISIK